MNFRFFELLISIDSCILPAKNFSITETFMNIQYIKILLFAVTALVVLFVSYSYMTPTANLGDFSKFSPNSEINQAINVAIVNSRTMERTPDGKIASFFAKDKNNVELLVTPHEPVSEEIFQSEVVELLGHLHGDVFTASRVTAVNK